MLLDLHGTEVVEVTFAGVLLVVVVVVAGGGVDVDVAVAVAVGVGVFLSPTSGASVTCLRVRRRLAAPVAEKYREVERSKGFKLFSGIERS